jgi:hypothetical protein
MTPQHALHNEMACNMIFDISGGEFNDWIITTAFYSALHFVIYDIFPAMHNGELCKNLSEYHIRLPHRISKHAAIIQLVKARHRNYSKEYCWLFDVCMYARYINYKIPDAKAILARTHLASIKSQLSKPVNQHH